MSEFEELLEGQRFVSSAAEDALAAIDYLTPDSQVDALTMAMLDTMYENAKGTAYERDKFRDEARDRLFDTIGYLIKRSGCAD